MTKYLVVSLKKSKRKEKKGKLLHASFNFCYWEAMSYQGEHQCILCPKLSVSPLLPYFIYK